MRAGLPLRELLLAAMLLGGCADGAEEQRLPTKSTLDEGIVARVGGESIALTTVARIAQEQGISVAEARDRAIADALLALGARERLPAREVTNTQSRALAHALLRQLWLDLSARPISDRELAEATEVRWTWWDRPEGRRTIHFVVQVKDTDPPERHDDARALAERLRELVIPIAELARREPAPARTEEGMFTMGSLPADPVDKPFEEAVESVDHAGFDVLAQVVHPITADGRPIGHQMPLEVNYYDPTYAKETAALSQRGDLTGVISSYAGYHVAMLLEVTPARRASEEERRVGLRDEIIQVRMRRAHAGLLKELRTKGQVEVPVNATSALELIEVGDR